MWDTNGGVYFGYSTTATEEDEKPDIGPERRYTDDRHLMTIGPNGSGKSRRTLLPNLAELKDWSIVVVDPKGELAKMAATYRDPDLKNTIILDPFGVSGFASDGYN